MFEDIKMLLSALVALFLITLVFVLIIYCIESAYCSSYQAATGRETKMAFGKCYIKHGGQWYTKDEFSKINKIIVTKGAK